MINNISYGYELNKNFRAIEKKDTFLKNSNKNFFWLLQRKYYTVLFCHPFYNNLGKTKLSDVCFGILYILRVKEYLYERVDGKMHCRVSIQSFLYKSYAMFMKPGRFSSRLLHQVTLATVTLPSPEKCLPCGYFNIL